jgi:hypothetical protein
MDRLKAAYFLGRAWRDAGTRGARPDKAQFEGLVLEKLQRPHGRREEFRLNRWTLPRRIVQITPEIARNYKTKNEPQKSLEPYLAAVAVLAELEGAEGGFQRNGRSSS